MSVKTVRIGRLTVTVPAVVIASVSVVVSLLSMLALSGVLPFPHLFAISLSLLLTGFFWAYNANCAVVGHCQVWSWVLVAVFVLHMIGVASTQSQVAKVLTAGMKKSKKH